MQLDRDLQEDLERLLDKLFKGRDYNRQARYIVGIGAQSAQLLRAIYRFVSSQAERASRLSDYPLKLIGIASSQEELDEFTSTLEGLPAASCIADNPAEIADCMFRLGVSEAAHCLFVAKAQDPQWRLANLEAAGLERSHGCLLVQETEHAAQTLSQEAERAYLPLPGAVFCYPKHMPIASQILAHYRKRSYKVRSASAEDLDQLLAIEAACWPEQLRQSKELLAQRINNSRMHCLVIELDGEVIAVSYAQRIEDAEDLLDAQAMAIDQLASENGPVMQLIALNMLPGKGPASLEEEFLEYCLQYYLALNEVEEVAAVLRCENYPGADVISFPSYVEELKIARGSADLATRLHVEHGAEIIGCARDYRESDDSNLGYGVLVSYKRDEREVSSARVKTAVVQSSSEFTPQSIAKRVDERVKAFSAAANYSRLATWPDLDLSNTTQLELRADLSQQFQIDLPNNFLDQYPSAQAVIDYLIDHKIRTFKEWLYETRWVSSAKPPHSELAGGKHWLLFSDESEVANSIAERLRELGQRVTLIERADSFRKHTGNHYSLDPSLPSAMKELFIELNQHKVHAAIYLWGKEEVAELNMQSIHSSQEHCINGLYQLANELMLNSGDKPPRLWVITQSIALDGSDSSLIEWPLGALCKVIWDEYPKLRPCYIAMDANRSSQEAADEVLDELRGAGKERFVAYRRGERLTPRLQRLSSEGLRLPQLSAKARYLIIGGLRPLGLLMARWHVAKGARRLILAGELEPSTEAKLLINEFQKQGIQVLTPRIDIEDPASLKHALSEIERDGIPLKGAMHAAGLVDNDLLLRMSWERFERVHRLKVNGAWALHEATAHLQLDHFILWSSCLPDIAPMAKANHATGNSFLDALAYYRQKRGLPALAIDCGPWDLQHIEVRRVDPLSKTEVVRTLSIDSGLQLLDHLYYCPHAQVTAAQIEWQQVLHNREELDPLFEEIAIELGYRRVPLMESYQSASEEEKPHVVQDYLHEAVRRLLGLASGSSLELEVSLERLGFDDRLCSKLNKRLRFDLQDSIRLPFDLITTSSTLEQLSLELLKRLSQASALYARDAVAVIVKVDGGFEVRALGDVSDELAQILNHPLFKT